MYYMADFKRRSEKKLDKQLEKYRRGELKLVDGKIPGYDFTPQEIL